MINVATTVDLHEGMRVDTDLELPKTRGSRFPTKAANLLKKAEEDFKAMTDKQAAGAHNGHIIYEPTLALSISSRSADYHAVHCDNRVLQTWTNHPLGNISSGTVIPSYGIPSFACISVPLLSRQLRVSSLM